MFKLSVTNNGFLTLKRIINDKIDTQSFELYVRKPYLALLTKQIEIGKCKVKQPYWKKVLKQVIA